MLKAVYHPKFSNYILLIILRLKMEKCIFRYPTLTVRPSTLFTPYTIFLFIFISFESVFFSSYQNQYFYFDIFDHIKHLFGIP